jgi:hypothetical protein
VHEVGGVGQSEMHTADPFLPKPCVFKVEFTMGKLKRCKSSGGRSDSSRTDSSRRGNIAL